MKILLIDDDRDDQVLFCEAVSQISTDITCDVADNGLEGITRLNSSKVLPDLLFLDINMPILDGRETLKLIRATPRLSDLSVIIYSTSNNKDEITWFEKLRARYVTKPNRFETLVQLLKQELVEVLMNEQNQLVIQKAC
jgi:CheY-like chemotaxis protein